MKLGGDGVEEVGGEGLRGLRDEYDQNTLYTAHNSQRTRKILHKNIGKK